MLQWILSQPTFIIQIQHQQTSMMSDALKTFKCNDAKQLIYKATIARFGETKIDSNLCLNIAKCALIIYSSHCTIVKAEIVCKKCFQMS